MAQRDEAKQASDNNRPVCPLAPVPVEPEDKAFEDDNYHADDGCSEHCEEKRQQTMRFRELNGYGAGEGRSEVQEYGDCHQRGREYDPSRSLHRKASVTYRCAGAKGNRLAALGTGDGRAGFLVAFAGSLGGALVPVLLAFGQGEFALDAAVAEVKLDRDERVTLLLR